MEYGSILYIENKLVLLRDNGLLKNHETLSNFIVYTDLLIYWYQMIRYAINFHTDDILELSWNQFDVLS